MALRQKLYYDFAFPTGDSETIFPICAGTGETPDRYGNLLEPNKYSGAGVSNISRCRQAIGAWAVIATTSTRPNSLRVDFVRPSGVGMVDPAIIRRPSIRVRAVTATQVTFVVYVQRQHSVEV